MDRADTRIKLTATMSIALCVITALLIWPEPSRSQDVRQTLKQRAQQQRAQGAALHDALCASCHDGTKHRDLLATDRSWRPGPLELLTTLNTSEPPHHDYSYLAETDLMAIVQHIRHEAKLDTTFDESHIPDKIAHIRTKSPCPDSLKAHVTEFTQDTSAATLERGKAIWEASCTSCHVGGGDGKKPAPALDDPATIWRRKANKLAILQGLSDVPLTPANEVVQRDPRTGQPLEPQLTSSKIPAHSEIQLDEETQIWPLVTWMTHELIPPEKLHEEPEIPMRGYILTHCQNISKALPRPEVESERLFDYKTWAQGLPDIPLDDMDPMAPQKRIRIEPLTTQQSVHLARLTTAPCLGCHVEGLDVMKGSEEAVRESLALLLGQSERAHPAFGKTYTLQHWSAVLGAYHGEGAPVDTRSIARLLKAHHGIGLEPDASEDATQP